MTRERCPIGELVGDPHTYRAGSGRVVPWDVAGDPRAGVEVCATCAGDPLAGVDPDTIRTAGELVARWARSFHDHPDTVPVWWPVGDDWPDGVRARAARLHALGVALLHAAHERGDQ